MKIVSKKRKMHLVLVLFVLIFSAGKTLLAQEEPSQNKTKLVVGIVVDQMRADYISRYYHRFSDAGFKRIISDGFQFRNAHYNYKATSTGPGHASIYTGTTPSRHGIVSNSWYNKKAGERLNCVADPHVTPVGGSGTKGLVSTKKLEVTTVTDELMLWSNHKSKVISVSFKDRGAALPAGHNPTGAYWYDRANGDFVSSSYFMDALPKWVNRFNKKKLAHKYAKKKWNTLHPIETYVESTADNTPYEKIKWGKEKPVFPYDLSNDKAPIDRFTGTPFANQMLADIAIAAIEGERLGKDEFSDFLAISFSSTDIAGHAMAPRAVEIEDIYLRLDLDIARIMKALDTQVGKGNYTLFLTADHGAVDNPAYLIDNKYPAGRFLKEEAAPVFESVNKKYGKADWFWFVSTDEIYLNRDLINAKGLSLPVFQDFVANEVLKLPFISEVFTAHQLKKRNMTEPYAIMVQNSFHSKRSADILTIVKSGHLHGQQDEKRHIARYTIYLRHQYSYFILWKKHSKRFFGSQSSYNRYCTNDIIDA